MLLSDAMEIGEGLATEIAGRSDGANYSRALSAWLQIHKLDNMDRTTRMLLRDIRRERFLIELWRSQLPVETRATMNHPMVVLKHFEEFKKSLPSVFSAQIELIGKWMNADEEGKRWIITSLRVKDKVAALHTLHGLGSQLLLEDLRYKLNDVSTEINEMSSRIAHLLKKRLGEIVAEEEEEEEKDEEKLAELEELEEAEAPFRERLKAWQASALPATEFLDRLKSYYKISRDPSLPSEERKIAEQNFGNAIDEWFGYYANVIGNPDQFLLAHLSQEEVDAVLQRCKPQ
jgi:hypothetical protein